MWQKVATPSQDGQGWARFGARQGGGWDASPCCQPKRDPINLKRRQGGGVERDEVWADGARVGVGAALPHCHP